MWRWQGWLEVNGDVENVGVIGAEKCVCCSVVSPAAIVEQTRKSL